MPNFIKNDRLECIDNLMGNMIGVTPGVVYICLHYQSCTDTVLILNDNNVKQKYGSHHFRKLP